jgi:hypothetical protein
MTVGLGRGIDITAGVELREDGAVRVRGAVGFPPRIVLFEPLSGRRTLFAPTFVIPVPGLSVGLVGVVATITLTGEAFYAVGPGVLVGTTLTGEFDPFGDLATAQLAAATALQVPMDAGVALGIRGGLGVSATVASATGGISATGTLALHGLLAADVAMAYRAQRLAFDAALGLTAMPELLLDLAADVTVEAGAFGFKGMKKWEWKLAHFSWGSGLTVGVRFPFHYGSDAPFAMPSWEKITWIYPTPAELRATDLIGAALGPGRGRER